MRCKFIFCSKGMNTMQAIKVIDNFLLQDNTSLLFLCLESLTELFVFHKKN